MSNETRIGTEIPGSFKEACEAMDTDPQQALQALVGHLFFYAQIISPGDDPGSQAGILLREYLDSRRMTPVPDYRTREINIRYTQEVLAMLRTKMSVAKRQKLYLRIVNKWYEELQLVNN